MGYHHLALACKDMQAIHAFYEGVMGFELVKVEVGPVPEGGWGKHFFYRMEDNSENNNGWMRVYRCWRLITTGAIQFTQEIRTKTWWSSA